MLFSTGPLGTRLVDYTPDRITIRITGTDGQNAYSWVQCDETNPALPDGAEPAFFMSGSTTNWPAREVNNATVPIGTKAWAWIDPSGTHWWFAVGGGGGGEGGTCGCCWVADLEKEDILRLTVDWVRGTCTCLDAGQVLYLRYSDDVNGWVSNEPFTTCCGESEVVFFVDEGRPRLRDLETRGCCSPPAIPPGEFVFDCCDPCVVWFCGGGPCHCQGGSSPTSSLPGENLFRLKVECWPADPYPPPPPPPPGEVSCSLVCPQICAGVSLPDRVKITITNAGGTAGDCASVPAGGYTFYAWHDATDSMPHLWKVLPIDQGTWGLHGYIECGGPCVTPSGQVYCGPPAFRGGGWCAETLLYAFACCTYLNQYSVIDSCSPFKCRIFLAVGFHLVIEDDSGVCT
jgi:hypothetical protein